MACSMHALSPFRYRTNSSKSPCERDIMQMNMDLASVETIFLLAKPEHQFISSSLLKEIASTGTDISAYVPQNVKRAFDKKLGK